MQHDEIVKQIHERPWRSVLNAYRVVPVRQPMLLHR
jgi:hypothetical protein